MIITDEAIRAAEDQLAAAERELADVRQRCVRQELSYTAVQEFAAWVQAVATRLEELRARQPASRVQLHARAAAERAAAARLSARRTRVEQSGARCAAKLAAALTAMREAVQAAADHDGEVADLVADLVDLDLHLGDGADHQTGASPGLARLYGAYWSRLNPAAAIPWLATRAQQSARTAVVLVPFGARPSSSVLDALLPDGPPAQPPGSEAA